MESGQGTRRQKRLLEKGVCLLPATYFIQLVPYSDDQVLYNVLPYRHIHFPGRCKTLKVLGIPQL